jgi:hypothetical protein
VVVVAEARGLDDHLKLEIPIAPLRGPSGQIDRLIGLYQPIGSDAAPKGLFAPMLRIRGISTTAPGGEAFPRLRLAAVDGRTTA